MMRFFIEFDEFTPYMVSYRLTLLGINFSTERASGETSAISLDLESPRNLGRGISSRYSNRQPCCFSYFFVFLIFFLFFPFFFSMRSSRSKIVFLSPAVIPQSVRWGYRSSWHGMANILQVPWVKFSYRTGFILRVNLK